MQFLSKSLMIGAVLTFGAVGTANAGERCRSEAYEKADAEEYCEGQLKCADKTPPQETKCRGNVRRWICKCAKVKSENGSEQSEEVKDENDNQDD